MNARRVLGIVLVVIGTVVLLWGGVFWTERETVLDAGPVEVVTDQREGVAVPPLLGAVVLIAGIALLVVPSRRRV